MSGEEIRVRQRRCRPANTITEALRPPGQRSPSRKQHPRLIKLAGPTGFAPGAEPQTAPGSESLPFFIPSTGAGGAPAQRRDSAPVGAGRSSRNAAHRPASNDQSRLCDPFSVEISGSGIATRVLLPFGYLGSFCRQRPRATAISGVPAPPLPALPALPLPRAHAAQSLRSMRAGAHPGRITSPAPHPFPAGARNQRRINPRCGPPQNERKS